MSIFDYSQWLAGHSTSKSMMEKLERSLIPYELFALVPIKNDQTEIRGSIEYCGNRYAYRLSYSYNCIGHDVYDAVIDGVSISDSWNNPLLGYNRFKVVMKGESVLTIYSDHEDYFQRVIDMFENEDVAGLYSNRSSYVNNLLARYILLRLIEAHYPEYQLLAPVKSSDEGIISVMAANANRTALIMYAFSKSSAIEIARHYDGLSKNLTVVYFINRDFERDGNDEEFDTGSSKVISIRQFYNSLPLDNHEKLRLERQILLLVSLLYDEPVKWNADSILRIVMNPPKNNSKNNKEERAGKNKSRKKQKKSPRIPENAWYHRIYRTLLEDALNVLHDTPVKHADIFHFLCAANMVNAYVNYCKRHELCSRRYLNRMYRAKQQIADSLIRLAESRNSGVAISVNGESTVFASIAVDKMRYQFSFRGVAPEHMSRLKACGLPDGHYEGYSLQSIATALYQFSLISRWKYV